MQVTNDPLGGRINPLQVLFFKGRWRMRIAWDWPLDFPPIEFLLFEPILAIYIFGPGCAQGHLMHVEQLHRIRHFLINTHRK